MRKAVFTTTIGVALLLTACGDAENNGNANENEANAALDNNENDMNNDDVHEDNNEQDNENEELEEENEENAEADEEMNGNEEDAADEIAEDGWETEVGETIENEGGTFTLHARQDDIDTIETGPVVIDIEQVNAQSGELSQQMADMLETEELEMIQMDLTVENTADEDITFYVSQATIATSTGEQLESDMWLSDHIDGDMMSGTSHNGTFFFVLENSAAEDVESVRITWSSPTNEDWEDIGEDVDIEVEF
ncbi:hypothetical protein ACFO4L_07375 [Bacillus daqingensis]|uniref:DUF4352 domain-containing protein n=1 Tax=Bacillus daqingensis TaxID=872396 RepID=A0ABV9NSM0_9BACI